MNHLFLTPSPFTAIYSAVLSSVMCDDNESLVFIDMFDEQIGNVQRNMTRSKSMLAGIAANNFT
jgi:hypothetical protein